MERTLNYTGRKRIKKHEVSFSINQEGSVPCFTAEFKLDDHDFPGDASVYIEATCNLTRQRFNFGSFSKIVPPDDCRLTGIDLSGNTLFRVLIVDNSGRHGLLLASGKDFRGGELLDEMNKDHILPLIVKPMDQLLWKIEFVDGAPELYLNSNIPNAKEKMKSDPYFQALVLPAALREVLLYLMWNDTDEDSEIYKKWINLATYFGDTKPIDNDPEVLVTWINDVVVAFSKKFEMCDRLLKVMEEE